MPAQTEPPVTERLAVPLGWWLLGTGFVLSLGIAVLAFLGPWWGIGVTVVAESLVAAVLVGYGSTRIVVDDAGVRVGRATIDYAYVREVRALDADRTLERLRTRADPRAYLVVRPYVRTSLELTLADPADPHPYWLISSRDAERLVRRIPTGLVATDSVPAEPVDG